MQHQTPLEADMMEARLRKTGIGVVESLSWGTHVCQFYETREDLLDVLVPYYRAGLESNELCLWITSEPLEASEAHEAMTTAVPQFDGYVQSGQMQIIPHTGYYLQDGSFSQQKVLGVAASRIAALAENGYSGLRASGNMGWLEKQGWKDFTRFEEVVDSLIGENRMIAICSYPLTMCGVQESLDVMKNHRLALIKQQGAWQVIENLGRTKMEAALRQTEEKYRHLFESTQDGMEVIDGATGRVVLANKACARMFGFDNPEDMLGTNPLDYVPPDSIWLSAIGVKTEYEGRLAGLVSLRDITEHKKAEQAFRDSERRYRLLAENVTDVIWVTEMNLRPTYVSASVARLLGYSVEEALSQGLTAVLTPASFEAAKAAFSRALEQQGNDSPFEPPPSEVELVRKDGTTVWVESKLSFVRDASGQPVEALGVLREVTERKKAEEQLRQSLEVLERTMEGTIQAIASTVETKDPFTAGHQRRVTQLACAVARQIGLPKDRLRAVRTAGLLHDLGKISLPADILTKPGKLTELEFAVIRTHPQIAYDVLKKVESFGQIAEIVLQHHERMDGSGYPSGLRGEEIHLEARILAVSDVVEAMSSHRPYRPALGLDKAREEILQKRGTLYDPEVVQACLNVFDQTGFEFEVDGFGPLNQSGISVAGMKKNASRLEGRRAVRAGRAGMKATRPFSRHEGVGDVTHDGKHVATVKYDVRCTRTLDAASMGKGCIEEEPIQALIKGTLKVLEGELSLRSDVHYALHLQDEQGRECDFCAEPIDVVAGVYGLKGIGDFRQSPHRRRTT